MKGTFSNKDKSIMTANPDLTPNELLDLGLSNTGFERLMEQGEKEPKQVIKTETVKVESHSEKFEQIPINNIVDVKKEPSPNLSNGKKLGSSDVVTVRENKPNGQRFKMSYTSAILLNTKEYLIEN